MTDQTSPESAALADYIEEQTPSPLLPMQDILLDRRERQMIIDALRGHAQRPAEPDQERFCVAFTWAYGTAIERKYGDEPNDGLTPDALWAQQRNRDREFMRGVVRKAFAALSDTSTAAPAQCQQEPDDDLVEVVIACCNGQMGREAAIEVISELRLAGFKIVPTDTSTDCEGK